MHSPAVKPGPATTRLWPSIGVALAGGLWGLFWIPMRITERDGLNGGWGSVAIFVPVILLLTPIALARLRRLAAGGWPLAITGLMTGAAAALYAISLVHTEVARSLLLFYLTPVWSTLLARALIGERITPARSIAVLLGVAGLWVMLAGHGGVPLPRNAGDWMALAAGLAWAYGTLRLYTDHRAALFETIYAFLLGGAATSLLVLLGPFGDFGTVPELARVSGRLMAVAIATGVLTAATLAVVIWAAGILSPVRVGLLLMAEVIVGMASAAAWAGEPFGLREIAGTALIASAAILEVFDRPPHPPEPA